jgi:serine/threonine-protein kinase
VTVSSVESLASGGSRDPEETLAPGTVVGNYVIEGVLGVGGGGIVYYGNHRVLKRRGAIKILRRHLTASPAMVARFVREASAVSTIGHPNIVDIYEFDELADGRPFYVMELIEGINLRKLLEQCGRLSASEVLEVMEPMCEALGAAHAAGIVHRDLKASNVLVIEKDGRRSIKLVDFGVAKLLHAEPGEVSLTGPGAVLGSVHTMSPEQILCESPDTRSDIYSLGVLLFQLLTGRLPFVGKPEEVAMLHLGAARPKVSDYAPVPRTLDAIVLRAMDRERENRYQTTTAFIEDLRHAVAGAGATSDAALSGAAIGMYVSIHSSDTEGDALDDMSVVLDECEQTLRSSGFALALQNSDSILGVKILPGAADGRRAACREAKQTAAELLELLATRPAAHPSVRIGIGLHVGDADYRELEDRIEIVSGAVLDVDAWTRSDAQGLYLSGDFSAALEA